MNTNAVPVPFRIRMVAAADAETKCSMVPITSDDARADCRNIAISLIDLLRRIFLAPLYTRAWLLNRSCVLQPNIYST